MNDTYLLNFNGGSVRVTVHEDGSETFYGVNPNTDVIYKATIREALDFEKEICENKISYFLVVNDGDEENLYGVRNKDAAIDLAHIMLEMLNTEVSADGD